MGTGTDRNLVDRPSSVEGFNFVEALTWDEVALRIGNGAFAILPIGAGAKEHGVHLPMNTDRIQAKRLAARLADSIDALIWPTVTYGYYPAFSEYAGSSGLSAPLFEALIEEVATLITGFRCHAFFVPNTRVSTMLPVDRALTRLAPDNVLHLRVYGGQRYRRAVEQLAEQSHDGHADELETSLMLALAPGLASMPRVEASPEVKFEVSGRLTPTDCSSPNYSRSGSYGDPTLATRAKGEVLFAAIVDDIVEQVTASLAERPAKTNELETGPGELKQQGSSR